MRPFDIVARPAAALDQAMAVEDRMDGALGRNPDIAVQPSDQQFPDLARAPVRLLGLETDNQALDLLRQPVGIAHRPPRSIAQKQRSNSAEWHKVTTLPKNASSTIMPLLSK